VAYVKRTFGKQYSRAGMTAWLKDHGFTFKKSEKTPGKLDPSRQAQFIEEYYTLKGSLGPWDELYFLDAVHPEYQSFGQFSILLAGAISTKSILPPQAESNIGQNNPENRRTLSCARGLFIHYLLQ
jgi:hypothetical protein